MLPAVLVAAGKAAVCTYLEPLQDHNWCCRALSDQVEPSSLDTGHLGRKDKCQAKCVFHVALHTEFIVLNLNCLLFRLKLYVNLCNQ